MNAELLGLIVLSLVGIASMVVMSRLRTSRERRDTEALEQSKTEGRNIPQTLHPIIDPDICIGSLSCLSVCPEGDILGVVDGKAALVSASSCIGHGKCALECPVGAIKLVFGTSERGVDLPEVSEYFETSRPGVHIVGELGGMGLIKNAITQGLQVADYLKTVMPKQSGKEKIVDVAIVGAGPAGLATALALKKHGVSFRVLEQESVGGTIAHYPRQKVVMTERVQLPIYGKFGKPLISKEELLESWNTAIKKAHLTIESGLKVERIDGEDGAFSVVTPKGTVAARKVVLAIGRRGTPRKLGAPGEELDKVAYRMIDPQQYEGRRLLVVGGGDAAIEAAIQVAEQAHAEVVLSYRQAEFGKAREANKQRLKELVESGQIITMMSSQVRAIARTTVTLETPEGQRTIYNDYVIACLGGELPTDFLKACQIGLRRYKGESPGDVAKAKRGSATGASDEPSSRILASILFAIGVFVVGALAAMGWEYYQIPVEDRSHSPEHDFLKPSGEWGHGVGIAATIVMLSNFFYAIRKRWSPLKGFSTIRRWLTFHQFVGFLSPVVIIFHSAFQAKSGLAIATSVSLGIVVATGVVGRFIFGLVPSGQTQAGELEAIADEWAIVRKRMERTITGLQQAPWIAPFVHQATRKVEQKSLGVFLAGLPLQYLRDRIQLFRVGRLMGNREDYARFFESFKRLRRLQAQASFYRSLKRLLSAWRVFHVVLAVLLVVMIAAHIAVSWFLGYKWIFS